MMEGKQFVQEFTEARCKFDEIIAELPAYGTSLAKIKATYDNVITKIEAHHRVRSVVDLQETQLKLQESTMKNYFQYQNQLETKLNKLKEENKRLKESIFRDKEQRELMMKEKLREIEIERGKKRVDSTRRRRLRLSVEQATSIGYLDKELERVEKELQEVKIATEKRHVPASRKAILQAQLQDKEKEKSRLERENSYLYCLHVQLSAALKSAVSVYSSLQSGETPFSNTIMTDRITHTIGTITDEYIKRVVDQMNEEDRDEEKEAEFILYCTEKFHELFESEHYEEAALLVATSPMGFLRNLKTLEKFKSVSTGSGDSATPLLQYCTTLMHSAGLCKPLSTKEAMEFVVCALDCRQYVLLMKWIASGNAA